MTTLTYSDYVTTIANLLVVEPSNAEYLQIIPSMINDAELRLYRDLDLLQTYQISTGAMTAGNRNFNLPTANGFPVVVETINVITPAGTEPESGTRVPLWPISYEAINMMFPSVTGSGTPQYMAMLDQDSIVVGPWPNGAYVVEVQNTIRPGQLSSSQVTTLLSTYFPDLLVAASMVFGAGYQKNFGAAVDDPKASVTWESHYQSLLMSAAVEEQRKKFQGPGWSSSGPTMAGKG